MMIEIARHGDFVLYKRHHSAEWTNLKLVREGVTNPKQKRCWWFAWNGERISRTRDANLLLEYFPGIHEWVQKELAAR